jgi:hypothetical protein
MSGNARQATFAERAASKGPDPEADTADASAGQEEVTDEASPAPAGAEQSSPTVESERPRQPDSSTDGEPPSAVPPTGQGHPARTSGGLTSRLRAGLRARRGTAAGLVAAAAIAVVLLLAIAIVFKVLGANAHNSVVSALLDTGKALAGPFNGMFTPNDPKLEAAINWGIALVVYYLAGQLAAKWLAR